ncbi:MAG: carboxylating nicotinate-nucleotide diphosphorylase [Bernardetiaceae bacterium]
MDFPAYLSPVQFEDFVRRAFAEDVGDGDHATLAAVPATATRQARLLIKDEGCLAGVAAAVGIFAIADPDLVVQVQIADGAAVSHGQVGFQVKGKAQSILTAERLVLNTMQRMSGIATLTQRAVRLLDGTRTRLLDTRKTTPNFRAFEKWAVRIGGGQNHRFGLYDLVMLKDNHIDFAGGIAQAIASTRAYLRDTQRQLRIEIETRNLTEVEEVLSVGGVDIIMLDNMSPEQMKTAVALIGGRFETEASGGITLDDLPAVAAAGVDFVSMGALTHSAQPLDMSLKADG